jgi:hypothetical protein
MTPMSLVQLLTELGGAELVLRREDPTLAVAVLAMPGGRQVLAMERTYREGIRTILDPTPEEIEIARNGDPWKLWSSDRAASLFSAV